MGISRESPGSGADTTPGSSARRARRIRSAGKKFQVHVHAEAFGPGPCHGQLMGFPANLEFDWRTWLAEGLADGITLRTTWFEAPEADRGLLHNALDDSVVEEALALCNRKGIPVYLNRYLKRAVSMQEYVSRPGADLPGPAVRRLRRLRVRPPLQAESGRHENRARRGSNGADPKHRQAPGNPVESGVFCAPRSGVSYAPTGTGVFHAPTGRGRALRARWSGVILGAVLRPRIQIKSGGPVVSPSLSSSSPHGESARERTGLPSNAKGQGRRAAELRVHTNARKRAPRMTPLRPGRRAAELRVHPTFERGRQE